MSHQVGKVGEREMMVVVVMKSWQKWWMAISVERLVGKYNILCLPTKCKMLLQVGGLELYVMRCCCPLHLGKRLCQKCHGYSFVRGSAPSRSLSPRFTCLAFSTFFSNHHHHQDQAQELNRPTDREGEEGRRKEKPGRKRWLNITRECQD